jgi:hypothetical protein
VINKKTVLETVAVLSGLENTRTVVGLTAAEVPVRWFDFKNINRKIYLRSRVNYRFEQVYMTAGVVVKNESIDELEHFKFDTLKNPNSEFTDKHKGQGTFLMPFVDFSGKIREKLSYSVGLRANYFSFSEKIALEPTASITADLRENESVKLSYSRQSQMMTPSFYLSQYWGGYLKQTNQFDFIKSDNINLTYNRRLSNGVQLTATVFGQFYRNIIDYEPNNSNENWSMLDNLVPLSSYGGIGLNNKAQTIGIEATAERKHQNGWFWQANMTLFDASFKRGNVGEKRSLENNSRIITNAYFGKEWTLGSRNNKFLGVGSRTILRGGNKQRLTTLNWSTSEGKQISPYFRSDLNVYVKKNHRKWSSIVQLDIQNVTNRLNEQYYYFDSFTQKLTPQLQLGLLPNLSYRISF